jgi:hypothetical protein
LTHGTFLLAFGLGRCAYPSPIDRSIDVKVDGSTDKGVITRHNAASPCPPVRTPPCEGSVPPLDVADIVVRLLCIFDAVFGFELDAYIELAHVRIHTRNRFFEGNLPRNQVESLDIIVFP